ncbi:hypothetical protein QR680_008345 [Steinernema hermaphroditum]|uniref:Transmembrane protein n=1 Tax=Steinernema hermaphroditum TaxID=289476 RepID=A0AA39IGB9_9BILA|nr:hypothetical protein QR680_008345 [Steinernema hermaphroditum]
MRLVLLLLSVQFLFATAAPVFELFSSTEAPSELTSSSAVPDSGEVVTVSALPLKDDAISNFVLNVLLRQSMLYFCVAMTIFVVVTVIAALRSSRKDVS